MIALKINKQALGIVWKNMSGCKASASCALQRQWCQWGATWYVRSVNTQQKCMLTDIFIACSLTVIALGDILFLEPQQVWKHEWKIIYFGLK